MIDPNDTGSTADLFAAELAGCRRALTRAAGIAQRQAYGRPAQRAVYEARRAVQRALDLTSPAQEQAVRAVAKAAR